MVIPAKYDRSDGPYHGNGKYHTPIRTPAPLDVFETFVASETFSEALERFDELIADQGIKDSTTKSIELLFAVS